MLNSNSAGQGDAFEVVSMKFQDGTPLPEQKQLMEQLNQVVQNFDGFKSRDYYYSSDNGRWIDFVVWTDVSLAKKASEQVMQNPEAGKVFAKIEEQTMIFSHYERIGGTKK